MNQIEQAFEVARTLIIGALIGESGGVLMSDLENCLGMSETRTLREHLGLSFSSDVTKYVIGKLALEGIIVNAPGNGFRYILNPNRPQVTPANPVTPNERADYETRIAALERQLRHLYRQTGYIMPE